MRLLPTLLLASAALAGCASLTGPKPIATATLNPTAGNKTGGAVSFVQKGDQVLVDARVDGLTPGPHGIHIHEKGDCSAPDAMSAGGHFNPAGRQHGSPGHAERHAGDFGNLSADASGNASLQLALPTTEVTLAEGQANSIIGRAVVVHADADDYTTQPAGNSGKRVACGVIRLR